ncbi:hypothetical protein [Brevundimonas sp.]|uniref:hypothetical protein n=1 Tax=Brevundimonas sp. TaxID=1871086 RepID=UPI0028A8BF1E|nr:hypothetical protein [Brevundimonas sp.]
MSRKDLGLRAIFLGPAVLFALSLVGLIGALLEEGWLDWIYAGCLGATLVTLTWVLVRRRR